MNTEQQQRIEQMRERNEERKQAFAVWKERGIIIESLPIPDMITDIDELLSFVKSQEADCQLEFEAKLLGFPNEGDRIKLCETCLQQAIADNFVIFSSGIPRASRVPVNKDYLIAEMRHLSNPESDWPYGHRFQQQENGASKCLCGFTLTPAADLATSMRSACVEKAKSAHRNHQPSNNQDYEYGYDAAMEYVIKELESLTLQEQEAKQ